MPERTQRSLRESAGAIGGYYGEVFAVALQGTRRFANRQGLGVATILAVAAAVVQASMEKHLMVWHLIRAGLIALGVLTTTCLLVESRRCSRLARARTKEDAQAAERDLRLELGAARAGVQSELDVVRQGLANTQYELERAQAAEQVFGQAVIPMIVRDRLVRLADLPPGIWLHDRVFENCQFVGPAKILIGGGGSFNLNRFYGFTGKMFVTVDGPEMERHFRDSIVFQDCRVSGCEFHNVRVLGDDGTIRNHKQGLTIKDQGE